MFRSFFLLLFLCLLLGSFTQCSDDGDGKSQSSESNDDELTGTVPTIESVVANDPDDGDAEFSDGDVITFNFDIETNQSETLAQADVNVAFALTDGSWGDSYSGEWSDSQTLVITFTDISGATEAPEISDTTFTLAEEANIRNADETSVAATDTSPTLSGDWGTGDCAGTGNCMIFSSISIVDAGAGVSGIDAHCEADANKPNDSTYKAMIADGTNRTACTTANCGGGTGEHLDWVLLPNKTYVRRDGITVVGTTTANGVFNLPLTNAIELTVTATNSTRTGLNTDWTTSANDCNDWGDNTAGFQSAFALHDTTTLLFGGASGCGNNAKVICVEQ